MERFSFRKLRVYQRAQLMSKEVNRLARQIPKEHIDLAWQIRRAARSVVLNIAEGAGEYPGKEKARIYRIARRSAWETVAGLDLALDESLFTDADLDVALEHLDAVIGMVTNIGRKAEKRADASVEENPRPRPRPGRPRSTS
jgi:four helix bundle protein